MVDLIQFKQTRFYVEYLVIWSYSVSIGREYNCIVWQMNSASCNIRIVVARIIDHSDRNIFVVIIVLYFTGNNIVLTMVSNK